MATTRKTTARKTTTRRAARTKMVSQARREPIVQRKSDKSMLLPLASGVGIGAIASWLIGQFFSAPDSIDKPSAEEKTTLRVYIFVLHPDFVIFYLPTEPVLLLAKRTSDADLSLAISGVGFWLKQKNCPMRVTLDTLILPTLPESRLAVDSTYAPQPLVAALFNSLYGIPVELRTGDEVQFDSLGDPAQIVSMVEERKMIDVFSGKEWAIEKRAEMRFLSWVGGEQ